MDYGLYFHIPFCLKKCNYCDFLSFSSFDVYEDEKQRYFHALEEEWFVRNELIKSDDRIDSIYIGGGTPSYVDPMYIENIMEMVKNEKTITKDAEITIEVNPGTVTFEKLQRYHDAGINRLSIGIQSTHNRLLKSLGRIHNSSDCEEVFRMAKDAGFRNISADLIFGIPQVEDEPAQTFEEFATDIENVLSWGARHLSAYSIIVEEGTPLCELFRRKKAQEISPELERQMYYAIPKLLRDYHLSQYEISNYARLDTMSKHNLKYWKCLPYIGFGLGAASYYPLNKDNNYTEYIRESNTKNFTDYLQFYFNGEKEIIDFNEQMYEFMMLGFRQTKGPDPRAFTKRFGCLYTEVFKEKLKKLAEKGLIILTTSAKLSPKGFDYANEVFREFVL